MLHLFLLMFIFVVAWQNLFIFKLPAFSSTAEIYAQVHLETAISIASKIWAQFVGDVYFILMWIHLESFFHYTSKLCQNVKFTKEEESIGEVSFLDTLLKGSTGKTSVLVYRKPTHTEKYLQYSSHQHTSC